MKSPVDRAAQGQISPVAKRKRPSPALLPAFEPSSQSPQLPRPIRSVKRASTSPKASHAHHKINYLPSAPTSSTFVPSSPSPRCNRPRHPRLQRTLSAVSERTPLAILPAIELNQNGDPVLLGRSSSSSHHQLSTNKLISRVHVRAAFIPAVGKTPKQVQVKCLGWNGVSVHCQGKAWDLFKGDTFTSETEDVEVLVHVHDSRVLIKWPTSSEPKILTPTDSDRQWESEASPSKSGKGPRYAASWHANPQSSPKKARLQLDSPESPSHNATAFASGLSENDALQRRSGSVQIYEDASCDESGKDEGGLTAQETKQNLRSAADERLISTSEVLGDSDEENDPIIHSFGPFGANLNDRLGAIHTSFSPQSRKPLNPLSPERISPQRPSRNGRQSKRRRLSIETQASRAIRATTDSKSLADEDRLISVVINYLMYSQLSATPTSTLLTHLESLSQSNQDHSGDVRNQAQVSAAALEELLRSVACIGSVQREGKDAAGKALETEYYYVPEFDRDEARRNAVNSLGIAGRGLRNCRKSHKVGPAHPQFKNKSSFSNNASSNISGVNRSDANSSEDLVITRISEAPYSASDSILRVGGHSSIVCEDLGGSIALVTLL